LAKGPKRQANHETPLHEQPEKYLKLFGGIRSNQNYQKHHNHHKSGARSTPPSSTKVCGQGLMQGLLIGPQSSCPPRTSTPVSISYVKALYSQPSKPPTHSKRGLTSSGLRSPDLYKPRNFASALRHRLALESARKALKSKITLQPTSLTLLVAIIAEAG
jgi:hypothetical protein